MEYSKLYHRIAGSPIAVYSGDFNDRILCKFESGNWGVYQYNHWTRDNIGADVFTEANMREKGWGPYMRTTPVWLASGVVLPPTCFCTKSDIWLLGCPSSRGKGKKCPNEGR